MVGGRISPASLTLRTWTAWQGFGRWSKRCTGSTFAGVLQRVTRMVLPNEEPVQSLIIGKTAGRIRKRAWSWKPEFTRTGNYPPIESEKNRSTRLSVLIWKQYCYICLTEGSEGSFPHTLLKYYLLCRNEIYPLVTNLLPETFFLSLPFTHTLIFMRVLSSLHLTELDRMFDVIYSSINRIWIGFYYFWEDRTLIDMNQISNNPNELLSGIMPENPHYGYLIAAAVLLFWLIGVICGWEWTYSRPGSYRGNFLLDLLGPKTYRLVLGAFLVVMLALVLYLFVCTK